jgi:hypothetical protein
MTVQFWLSGLTVHTYGLTENPHQEIPAERIHQTSKDMFSLSQKLEGLLIDEELDHISACARKILDSIGPARAVDGAGQIIDKTTQYQELMILAADIHAITEIVRNQLINKEQLTRYAQDYPDELAAKTRLSSLCHRLDRAEINMYNQSAMLKIQINAQENAWTRRLAEETTFMSTDCLGIVAQYLGT